MTNARHVLQGLLTEVQDIAGKYQHRCDRSKVVSKSYWNKGTAKAAEGKSVDVGAAKTTV